MRLQLPKMKSSFMNSTMKNLPGPHQIIHLWGDQQQPIDQGKKFHQEGLWQYQHVWAHKWHDVNPPHPGGGNYDTGYKWWAGSWHTKQIIWYYSVEHQIISCGLPQGQHF